MKNYSHGQHDGLVLFWDYQKWKLTLELVSGILYSHAPLQTTEHIPFHYCILLLLCSLLWIKLVTHALVSRILLSTWLKATFSYCLHFVYLVSLFPLIQLQQTDFSISSFQIFRKISDSQNNEAKRPSIAIIQRLKKVKKQRHQQLRPQ